MEKFNIINEKNEYIPHLVNAFIPKYTEGSRYQRRQELLEINDLNILLYRVEELFYHFLFDCPEVSYNEAYLHHLKLFGETCEYIKKTKKPKWFKINENYFHDEFAPRDVVDERFDYEEFGEPAKRSEIEP